MPQDFLEEVIKERSKKNPDFPEMVEAALRARRLLNSLGLRRQKLGISQTLVAAKMGTSQSALARIESGDVDPRLSTVERYANALGEELALRKAR